MPSLESSEWHLLAPLAVLTVVAALSPLWLARPRAIGRFARTVGLPLDGDEELERILGERLRRRAGWGAVGFAVGALACIPVILSGALLTRDEWGPGVETFAGLVLLGILLSGRGVGVAISILPAPPEVRSGGPRVARVPRPGVRDYVAPIERTVARILIVALGLIAVTAISMPGAAESRMLVGATALAAIVSLVVVEWVSSALVARPQPAVSEELLRWDDALRAQTLRDLISVPILFGAVAAFAAFSWVFEWAAPLGDAEMVAMNVSAYIVFIGLLVLAAYSTALRPARYYLRRLWPKQFAEAQPAAYGEVPAPEGA